MIGALRSLLGEAAIRVQPGRRCRPTPTRASHRTWFPDRIGISSVVGLQNTTKVKTQPRCVHSPLRGDFAGCDSWKGTELGTLEADGPLGGMAGRLISKRLVGNTGRGLRPRRGKIASACDRPGLSSSKGHLNIPLLLGVVLSCRARCDVATSDSTRCVPQQHPSRRSSVKGGQAQTS
jgi:hypothetical protein